MKVLSYGIVPLQKHENSWKVFLVRHQSGGHWSFPKGHPEEGESPQETAERELKEETGLEVTRYLDCPEVVEAYRFHHEGILVDKTVRFHFAEVTSEVSLQAAEILEGKWLFLSELLDYVTFDEERKLYQNVIKILKSY